MILSSRKTYSVGTHVRGEHMLSIYWHIQDKYMDSDNTCQRFCQENRKRNKLAMVGLRLFMLVMA